MNFMSWLSSKKTKDSVFTQVLVAGIVVTAMAVYDKVEDLKAVLEAVKPFVLMVVGMGGITVAGRTVIDKKLAERGEKKN